MKIRSVLTPLVIFAWLGLQASTEAALQTWDGGGTNNNWTTATNWVGDVAPSAGDDLLFPPGPTRLNPINNFPAGTTFNSLIFSGTNYFLDGNAIALNAGMVVTNAVNNHVANPLSLNSNQTVTINLGSASFYLAGPIDNKGNDLTFDVAVSSIAQVSSAISGAGGLLKTGAGSISIYASNTFSGSVQLNQGFISLYNNGNGLGSSGAGTTVAAGATLLLIDPMTVPEPLTLFGTLKSSAGFLKTWTGPITLAGPSATISVDLSSGLTINAVISGTNNLTKTSNGPLILNSNNTYTGTTMLLAGSLEINGNQPDSPVMVSSGTLAGTGTIGNVTFPGSTTRILSPGPIGQPGILTCSNLTLGAGTFFQAQLNAAAPGTGYDQLHVNGGVTLNNAVLQPVLGFTPSPENSFVLINNNGSDPVAGTFNGLTNGAVLSASGIPFQIHYNGGDGNDVVLTRISAPPIGFEILRRLPDGEVGLQATGGFFGSGYLIQAATNLSPAIQWSNIGQATADVNGLVSFNDTNAPAFPTRFYRAVSP